MDKIIGLINQQMNWETIEDQLDLLSKSEINFWLAVKVLNWHPETERIVWLNEQDELTGFSIQPSHGELKESDFDPMSQMNHAFWIINKLGLAIIPQSVDINTFRWGVTDIESVAYRGSEVAIRPLKYTNVSHDDIYRAVAWSALTSVYSK